MENCIISRDVQIEILARLSVKSLMRFKCVCKFFYSLIKSDRHFKQKHFKISRTKRDYAVFEYAPWRKARDFGCLYKKPNCDEIGCAHLTFPTSSWPINYIRYADGMFCLVTRIQISLDNYVWDVSIWNPSTREIMKLQNMEALDGFNTRCTEIGFGFSSNMIGKVVMIWTTPDPIVMVYSQDGNNSCGWKRCSHSLGIFRVYYKSNLYLKEKYYWISTVFHDEKKGQSHLLWFDFDDETFGKIELPEINLTIISAIKDNIALLSYGIDINHIEIWTMNEDNNIIRWNKYANMKCGRYSHPLRIWNLDAHLLVFNNKRFDRQHFISYDLVTQEKKTVYHPRWNFYTYPLYICSESLKSF